jgi:N-methylhydantoinase A
MFFEGAFVPSRLYRREALVPGDTILGPAMITEYTSATLLPPGCRVHVDGFRNLLITVPV